MPVVGRTAAPASRNRGIRGYGSRLKAGTTAIVGFDFQTARYASAVSRRDTPELCTKPHPSKQRAWGMPGARCTRSLVCKVLVAHECSHHRYSRIHPAFPHATVLTVSFVLSPAIGLSCHR